MSNLTPLQIYKQGIQAKREGKSADANPYQYGTKEFTYWWDGWADG